MSTDEPNLRACHDSNRILSVTPDIPGPEQLKSKDLVVGGHYLHVNRIYPKLDRAIRTTLTRRPSSCFAAVVGRRTS